MPEVTRLLHRVRDGDRSALEELMPLVYAELRRIAGAAMRGQPSGHTLQPTALVNEAFIKLFQGSRPAFADRAHFMALMSRVMRQILVDHARGRRAAKRGAGDRQVEWDSRIEVGGDIGTEQVELLDLHRVLESLEREEPDLAQVVEMHYFGGMPAEEASVVLERSAHVVRHQLRIGRAWLRRELAP